MTKTILIVGIIAAFIVGSISSATFASGANPVSDILSTDILNKLIDIENAILGLGNVFVTNDSSDPIPVDIQGATIELSNFDVTVNNLDSNPIPVDGTIIEKPNTLFINYVDTPYTAEFSNSGFTFVPLGQFGGNPLLLSEYRKVCLEVGSGPTTFDVSMGKISGPTLSSNVLSNVSPGSTIHCVDVMGPQMNLILRGDPNTTIDVQLWVYASS